MGRRKYLGRYDKDFIKSIVSQTIRTDAIGVAGYASLVRIEEVNAPCMVGETGSETCIANNGYRELTFLPDKENWQLAAVYDDHNNIVEWYVDIMRTNCRTLYQAEKLQKRHSIWHMLYWKA